MKLGNGVTPSPNPHTSPSTHIHKQISILRFSGKNGFQATASPILPFRLRTLLVQVSAVAHPHHHKIVFV